MEKTRVKSLRPLLGAIGLLCLVVLLMPASAFAGTHMLNTWADNTTGSVDTGVAITFATITTTADKGGNDATSATLTINSNGSGLASGDVASIGVYYGGALVGTAITNPSIDSSFSYDLLADNGQKGGSDWTFVITLNGSAGGKQIGLTVTSIVGSDDAVLAASTQINTVSAPNLPPVVSGLAQYNSDSATIASGGYSDGATLDTVIFEADITDNENDNATLRIEYSTGGFSKVADCSGTPVATPATNVQVTCTGIPDGDYSWQAWATDAGTGTEVAFSGGPPDFSIDTTGPTASSTFNAADAGTGGTCDLTWNAASDSGIGLNTTGAYKIYTQTGSAPACGAGTLACTQGSGSTGCSASSLTNDVPNYFTQCVYDELNNETTGLNTSCTPTVPGDTVTADTFTSVAPSSANANDQDVQMLYFRLYVSTVLDDGVATLDQIKVDDLVATADTDISNVDIYLSANAACCGGDTLIGSGSFVNGAPDSVTIDVTNQTIDTGGDYIFILYDIDPAAGSNTVQTDIADQNSIILLGNDDVAATSGGSSNVMSIVGAPVCTRNAPTIVIQAPTSQTIVTDGGTVNYTVRVTNTDTNCADETFDITLTDSNSVNFLGSQLNGGSPPLQIVLASGAFQDVTLTVRALAGETTGTNTTEVTVDDPNGSNTHAAVATGTDATTDINIIACDETIDFCYDCHGTLAPASWAPKDGASRTFGDAPTVVGDHDSTSHVPTGESLAECAVCHEVPGGTDTKHRDAYIAMNATSIEGGYYDKNNDSTHQTGAAPSDDLFAQDGSTTGVCRNTYCHGGAGSASPQWGIDPSGIDCGTCHPSKVGSSPQLDGNHSYHYQVDVLPGNRNAVNSSTGTEYVFGCLTCHNATKHPDGSNAGASGTDGYTVDILFNLTDWGASGGQYGSPTPGSTTAVGADSGFTYWTDATCSAVYCHSNAQSTPTYTTPTWSDGVTAGCTGCHGNAAANASVTLSNKHAKHMATDRYSYSCSECHAATVADNQKTTLEGTTGHQYHVNGIKNTVFSTTALPVSIDQSGGTFASNVCGSLYCHSDGKDSHTSVASPNWTSGTSTCTSCHSDAAGAGSLSGKHSTHAGTGNYGFACAECHDDTLLNIASNTILDTTTGYSTHVNGSRNVVFYTSMRGSGIDQSGGAYTDAPNNTCGSIYCHSDGDDTVSVTYKTAPDWMGVGGVSCTSCHNHKTTDTPMATNKHGAHVNNAGVIGTNYSCEQCHNDTTNDGDTIADKTKHVNGTEDVKFLKYSGSGTWDEGSELCATVYCHSSGQATPVFRTLNSWTSATTYDCKACHGADSGFSSQFGEPNYTSGAAGSATANSHSTKHIGAATDCNTCHTNTTTNGTAIKASSTSHTNESQDVDFDTSITGTGAGYTSGIGNKNCDNIYCHGAFAGSGVNSDAGGTPQWGGSVSCGDCHLATNANPPTRFAHSKHTIDTNLNRPCSDCHGSSAGATGHVDRDVTLDLDNAKSYIDDPFNATAPTYGGSDPYSSGAIAPTANPGACANVYCHSDVQTSDGTGGPTTYYSPDWNGDVGSITCTSCHKYDNASGTPMASGSHTKHLNSGYTCDQCHEGAGGGTSSHANYVIEVNSATNFTSYDQMPNNNPGNDYGSCASITCHNNSNATWGGSLDCSSCHPARTGGAAGTNLSASHATHFVNTVIPTALSETNASTTTNYVFMCGICHKVDVGSLHGDGDNGGPTNDGYYVDIRMSGNWDLDATPDNNYSATAPGGTSTGDSGIAYWNDGSCDNTYCHSNGNGTGVASPGWSDGIGTASCTTCHNHDTSDTPMATGAHGAHINQSTYLGTNFGCVECHNNTVSNNDTVDDKTYHINKNKDVAILKGGNSDCTNVYCHSDGTETPGYVNPPAWTTGSLTNDCKQCHGAGGSSIAGEPDYTNDTGSYDTRNSHQAHVTSGDDTTRCNVCHDATVNASGNLIASGSHLDSARDVSGTKIGSYTESTETCNSITCHGGGNATWGATLSCADCHKGTGDTDDYTYDNGTTASIDDAEWTNAGHGQSTGNMPLDCFHCHLPSSDIGSGQTASHGQSTNPFRLANNGALGASGDGWNDACLICHDTDGTGFDPDGGGGLSSITSSVKIDKWHSGTRHGGSNSTGGRFCWDCHDPHGDSKGGGGGYNIKMIHLNAAEDSDSTYGVPILPLTTDIIFTDNTIREQPGFGDSSGPSYNGVCNVCHDVNLPFDKTSGDSTHYSGTLCTDCHKHAADTTNDGTGFTPTGGDCVGCHTNDATGGGTDYVTRAVVADDFAQSTRHVFKTGDPSMWDCVVCHLEGNTDGTPNTGTDPGKHDTTGNSKTVSMRDVDNIGSGWEWDKNSPNHANMTAFCLSCHDSDGASGIAVNTTGDGMDTTPTEQTAAGVAIALAPFDDNLRTTGTLAGSNTDTTSIDLNNFGKSAAFLSTEGVCEGAGFYWDGSTCMAERSRVVDVKSQVQSTIASHGIAGFGGSRYTGHDADWVGWVSKTLKTGDALGTLYEESTHYCADCHTVDLNAHGSNTAYMVTGSSVDATCWECHSNTVYNSDSWGTAAASNEGGSRFPHTTGDPNIGSADGTKIGGSVCLTCHGGAPQKIGFGGIHGIPTTANDYRFAQQQYRFIGGAYMVHDGQGWTGTASSSTCYFDPDNSAQPFSNCTHHSGNTGSPKGKPASGNVLQWGRPTSY